MAIENTDKGTKYLRGAESELIQETYPPCRSGGVEASQRVCPTFGLFQNCYGPVTAVYLLFLSFPTGVFSHCILGEGEETRIAHFLVHWFPDQEESYSRLMRLHLIH